MMTTKQIIKNSVNWLKHPLALSDPTAVILFSLFFTIFENIAFWNQTITLLNWNTWHTVLLFFSFFIFIFCSLICLFSLLLWRTWFKPLLIALLLISAGVNYFCMTYSVYIDREMIQNVMRTDSQETIGLLTPQLILWIGVFGVIPGLFVLKVKIEPKNIIKTILYKAITISICLLIIVLASIPLYKDYASFFRNNREVVKLITPTNYIHAVISFAKQRFESMKPLVQIGLDAQLKPSPSTQKPTLLFMVVGEASRAQSFSLLGYTRQTNPLLSQRDDLITFQNVTSCGTSTAVSVPCMFSSMARTNYSASKAEHQENVLDIIQRAGIEVFWKDNNTGCQGQCLRIPSSTVKEEQTQGCKEDYCYDEQLLDNLDAYIAQRKGKNMLIVLHTIGSHGPSYYRRYSEETITPFKPACETNQIQNCSQEELMNVYDNTILHVDFTLNEMIEFLKKYESSYEVGMFYVSDHGQSLGENGIYLHAAPYAIAPKEQTQIPMMFWGSKDFITSRNINTQCLNGAAQTKEYSQDNVFHSLLGLMQVKTSEYDNTLDIFETCQNFN